MYIRPDFAAPTTGLLFVDRGMDINELKFLSNVEVDMLVKVVKHPGGITGVRGAAVAALGQGVRMQTCITLKLACYFIHQQQRTLRACTLDPYILVKVPLFTFSLVRSVL